MTFRLPVEQTPTVPLKPFIGVWGTSGVAGRMILDSFTWTASQKSVAPAASPYAVTVNAIEPAVKASKSVTVSPQALLYDVVVTDPIITTVSVVNVQYTAAASEISLTAGDSTVSTVKSLLSLIHI